MLKRFIVCIFLVAGLCSTIGARVIAQRGAPGSGAQTPATPRAQASIDLTGTLSEALRRVNSEAERIKIEDTLREAAGNKGRAAELLQISYKMLLAKLKDHGID